MELKWLEDYLALAKYNNFSEAAKARCMTQPAFSRRIRLLEAWLGVKLVNRDKNPIQLTLVGTEFLATAQSQVEITYRQKDDLQRFSQGKNTITIHTQHSLMVSHVPELLEHTSDSEFIRFTANNQQDALQHFLLSENDFLLCFSTPGIPQRLQANHLEGICIAKDRLLAVAAPNKQGEPLIKLSNKQPVRMLSYPRDSFFQRVIDNNCLVKKQLEIQIVFENVLAASLKLMAKKGYGFAWLPESLITQELSRKDLVLLDEKLFKPISLEVSLYRHKTAAIKANKIFWQKFKG